MSKSAEAAARDSTGWLEVVATAFRVLTFRASREELLSLSAYHLAFGLVCTWIVGMGRYYDNPRVGLLQHLGLGSVVYVFVFSLFIWLVVWPLRPGNWRYLRVCAFVSLVSPPAILYAIPVENFSTIDTANSVNAWFLVIVATWRVALLIYFLRVSTQFDWFSISVATFLPLSFIVVALTTLNLERTVLSVMGGFRETSPNDDAFSILVGLSLLSLLLLIPLLLCYLTIVVSKISARRRERLEANEK